jgi:hypothetical protein
MEEKLDLGMNENSAFYVQHFWGFFGDPFIAEENQFSGVII